MIDFFLLRTSFDASINVKCFHITVDSKRFKIGHACNDPGIGPELEIKYTGTTTARNKFYLLEPIGRSFLTFDACPMRIISIIIDWERFFLLFSVSKVFFCWRKTMWIPLYLPKVLSWTQWISSKNLSWSNLAEEMSTVRSSFMKCWSENLLILNFNFYLGTIQRMNSCIKN